MRATLKKLLAVTAAATLLMLPVTTGTAHAAETVHNLKTQSLTASPENTMLMSMVRREISLKRGIYGWWTYVAPPAFGYCDNFTGEIIAGDYVWTDQLWPGSFNKGWYRHDSYLSEPNSGIGYKLTCYFRLTGGDGTYTWGSGLDPHF